MMKLRLFENFDINEGSYNDFLNKHAAELKTVAEQLEEIKVFISSELSGDDYEPFLRQLFGMQEDNYDEKVLDWINRTVENISADININDIAQLAIENQDANGTEPRMVLDAIGDIHSQHLKLKGELGE